VNALLHNSAVNLQFVRERGRRGGKEYGDDQPEMVSSGHKRFYLVWPGDRFMLRHIDLRANHENVVFHDEADEEAFLVPP
jgi:hypothetical protein